MLKVGRIKTSSKFDSLSVFWDGNHLPYPWTMCVRYSKLWFYHVCLWNQEYFRWNITENSGIRYSFALMCLFLKFGLDENCGLSSPITKTLGWPSIRHRSNTFVLDRCLTDVDPKVFAICYDAAIGRWVSPTTNHCTKKNDAYRNYTSQGKNCILLHSPESVCLCIDSIYLYR